MNKLKLLYAILAIALGTFFFVFGEFDDSPGGQMIGVIIAAIGIVGIVKNLKKTSV